MTRILAVVPARGGSKSIPRKNILPLDGTPLIGYTLLAAKQSTCIQRIVVTTDDEEIVAVAKEYGGEVPFLRPSELALDHVTDLPVFQHCLNWLFEHEDYLPDIVVHLRPTAPFRQGFHIDKGINLLLASPDADSVRSVSPAGQHPLKMWSLRGGQLVPFIPENVYAIPEAYNKPRQILPLAFVQNGSVDVVRRNVIMNENSMTGRVIKGFVMDEEESVNIDNPLDWELAGLLMKRRRLASVPGKAIQCIE